MNFESDNDLFCESGESESSEDSEHEINNSSVEQDVYDVKHEWCEEFCNAFSRQWPCLNYVDISKLVECIEEPSIETPPFDTLPYINEEIIYCFCELSGSYRSDLVKRVLVNTRKYYINSKINVF